MLWARQRMGVARELAAGTGKQARDVLGPHGATLCSHFEYQWSVTLCRTSSPRSSNFQ